MICLIQRRTDLSAMSAFLQGVAYAGDPKAVGEFVAVPPCITPTDLIRAGAQEHQSQNPPPKHTYDQ